MKISMDIASAIYQKDGFRGYYRGYVASLMAYVPNSALWWTFYHLYQGENVEHDSNGRLFMAELRKKGC